MTFYGACFCFFSVGLGKEPEVVQGLQEISEVKETYVYGVYDMFARVETDNMNEIKDVIDFKIRKIENVRSTLTMIVV
jgi:DNA-binding Lrp family transcriptional regulator